VYDNAKAWGIIVNAISLGDASVKATMAELANQTGGVYADAADASALTGAFTALVVAKDKGYLTVQLIYPAGSRPVASSVITLTVTSGKRSATAHITLTR
jgi:hypothetical protein